MLTEKRKRGEDLAAKDCEWREASAMAEGAWQASTASRARLYARKEEGAKLPARTLLTGALLRVHHDISCGGGEVHIRECD